MVRLDLRETYLGRVRERERRSSVSEDVVVEGWAESGFVGALAGASECEVVVVEGEEVMGSGSVAVGAEVVVSVEAMVDGFDVLVGSEGVFGRLRE